VKKTDGCKPKTEMLPAQAIIKDRDTWITESEYGFATINSDH
jgi:hypothetical protein